VARAPSYRDDVADVNPLFGQGPHGRPRPEVRPHLADVAGAEAQPGAGGHGGGHDPATLDVELLELDLGVRPWVTVDDGDEIQGVGAEADDVEGSNRT
jgi:hypothetical protein